MSDRSAIEWTDATWNTVYGCTKVSPGCANCYISRTPPYRMKGLRFERGRIPVQLLPERLTLPLRWKKPRLVFVNSLSDTFHEDVPDGLIAWLWMTMARTPEHTYQVLTKRPERMLDFVRRWSDLSGEPREPQLVRGPEATRKAHPSGRGQLFAAYLEELAKASGVDGAPPPGAAWPTFDWMEGWRWYPTWPLPNVWLGVTVENQRFADERIPLLLETPAALRFLSCEPLLGPLDLRRWLGLRGVYEMEQLKPALIDWVIAGGESAGPAGRALVERCVAHDCRRLEDGVYCIAVVMDSDGNINNAIPCYACQGTGYRPKPEALAWVRSLRDQCQAAGVPFFFKQWGGPRPTSGGRLLDGRTWDEMPDHRRQQLTAQKPLDREEAAIH